MSTPPLAPRIAALPGAVYSSLLARFGEVKGETFPFHVGDTWMAPPEGCRTEDIHLDTDPGHNRYTPVPGHAGLIEAVARRVAARTGVPVAPEEVVIPAGATAGYLVALGAIVPVGGEVMILSPAWPLISGTTRLYGGVPVAVPFMGEGITAADVAATLDRYRTERTVAIYFNTPNNPTGLVLGADVVEALALWARAQGLWLISDEVYEDLSYVGGHAYARTFAPERTISAWSFSKAYGMAGNRVGYVVGPASVIAAARKVATYTYYCAPHVTQIAALRALGAEGDAWVSRARETYASLGREIAAMLGVPAPQGSTFLFLDLGDRDVDAFLGLCVERGILLAPGTSFGPYPRHARLCYTAVEPERTRRGVAILRQLLDATA